MAALQQLSRLKRLPLYQAQSRAVPRVSLASGKRIGLAIKLPIGCTAVAALELACDIARETAGFVSFAATGPFPALPGLIATALARTAVPPEHIELTVSNALLDDAGIEALLALSALRDQGVGIALRGFGRGKIAIVPRLPLSSVVLSSAIIRDIPGSAAATMLLQTLQGLASSQALQVVATGIDTEAQRAILSGIGCDAGEGSLFGTDMLAPDLP